MMMKQTNLLLTGFVAGALTMYFFDPQRRAARVLEQRIRSVMGESVSNPRAIEVRVDDGRIVLSGPVLTREADTLLAAVYRAAGERSVLNRLDYRDTLPLLRKARGS